MNAEQEARVIKTVDSLDAILKQLTDDKEGFSAIRDKVKTLTDVLDIGEMGGKEAKEAFESRTLTKIEENRANLDAIKERIANGKLGYALPGAERSKFSFQRAFAAARTGNWDKAGYEKEVFDATESRRAAQVIGSDDAGGFLVPDNVAPDVVGEIYDQSQFVSVAGDTGDRTRVTVVDGLGGPQVKVPKFIGGIRAYWIGEEDRYKTSIARAGAVTMSAKKLTAAMAMTREMLMWTGNNFEGLIRQDMIRSFADGVDWSVLYADGTENMPRGLAYHRGVKVASIEEFNANRSWVYADRDAARKKKANWGGANAQDHAINTDFLDEMRGVLDDDAVDTESGIFAMAPALVRRLKQLNVEHYANQTTGNPKLFGIPLISENRLREAIGEFVKSRKIPVRQTAGQTIGASTGGVGNQPLFTDLFFGDFRQIMLGRWGGIIIENDGGTGEGFLNDVTYVKASMYADIQTRQERALLYSPDVLAQRA